MASSVDFLRSLPYFTALGAEDLRQIENEMSDEFGYD